MTTSFASLNLSPRLLETLTAEGYHTPTPIQARAIPPLLEGRDLLGCAQTGTGKTAAFSLPLLERLTAQPAKPGQPAKTGPRRARALVLAPTRELAAQIEDSMRTYGRGTGLRCAVIYGGVKQFRQVRQLEAGVDVIVATPGRLLDLMEQGHVDLSCVQMFVLDEADRMLDMGFIEPIRQIGRAVPKERQTVLFSATMPPKIRQLADTMMRSPVSVSVTPVASTAPAIEQTLYHVASEHKPALLAHLLRDSGIVRTVVFTRTKHGAERLATRLTRDGVAAGAIHGNKSQNQRLRALEAFRSGRSRVLVATDVAARGLDVDGITHVFNYDLPNEPEAYVHRIGRTGRAGAAGRAISFCGHDERSYLRAIEKLTGQRITTAEMPGKLEAPAPAASAVAVHERPHPTDRPAARGPGRRPVKPRDAGKAKAATAAGARSSGPRRGSVQGSAQKSAQGSAHGSGRGSAGHKSSASRSARPAGRAKRRPA